MISRIRRFNRAVTREVGALDTSFLGLGRPLGVARVLNAVGHGRTDVGELRVYLGLDSGLLSRLLRTLEEEGLVEVAQSATDGRRREVALTQAGAAEFAKYEDLSDAQAEAMGARHPKPEVLLAAMDLVATALGRPEITLDLVDPRAEASRYCLEQYYAELSRRLALGFDVSLSRDPEAEDMIAPRGAFLVAMSDGLPLGCVGLKPLAPGVGEIKRLWVDPSTRGLGLGFELMARLEESAAELSFHTLRLDTNSALPEAARLYERMGWYRIDRYNDDPHPDIFFEKRLGGDVA